MEINSSTTEMKLREIGAYDYISKVENMIGYDIVITSIIGSIVRFEVKPNLIVLFEGGSC